MLRELFSGSTSGEPTGLDYLNEIKGLTGREREKVTLRYFRERWLPESMLSFADWPRVTLEKMIDGKRHRLVVQVSPDFAKVGSDEATAVVVPMWPTTSQFAADELSVRTIGRNLARAVYAQGAARGDLYMANPGEPYYDLKKGTPRNIDDSGAWAASARKRIAWLDKKVPLSQRARTLVVGYSKDVVQQRSAFGGGGKLLSGNQLAIYGGGGGNVDGWAIQPFPGPHEWSYGGDYSHGTRFARNRATLYVGDLPGKAVRLDEIAKNPVLSQLLVDTGPFDNRMSMPSVGNSLALDGSLVGGTARAEDVTYSPRGEGLTDSDEIPPSDEGGETSPISPLRVGVWTFAGMMTLQLLRMALRRRPA